MTPTGDIVARRLIAAIVSHCKATQDGAVCCAVTFAEDDVRCILEAHESTLRSELGGMREALEPFAKLAVAVDSTQPMLGSDFLMSVRMSDLRKARTTLSRVSNDTTVSEMGE